MNMLKVPLSKVTDQGLAIHAELTLGELAVPDALNVPEGNVTVDGTLSNVGGDYLFRGALRGAFAGPCDRCLEDARALFDLAVCWFFKEGPPTRSDDDDATDFDEEAATRDAEAASIYFEGMELDLRPTAWEEVALAYPAKLLCTEDCAGLCPDCGGNLNRTACRCRADAKLEHKGLAELADRFPELRPKRLED